MFGLFSKKSKITDLSWLGVDVHTHVLPGFDQSAPDLSSAKHLVQTLAVLGLKTLVCTPVQSTPDDHSGAHAAYLQLKSEFEKLDSAVELVLAGEYVLDQNFNAEGLIQTLNKRYVLVSLKSNTPASYQKLSQYVFELAVRNYKPILAHPERDAYLRKDKNKLKRLRGKGCLLQLNLLSLTGYYGNEVKSAALSLLKDELYDLAGTDLQSLEELKTLSSFTENGKLYDLAGKYPFKNKTLFSTIL